MRVQNKIDRYNLVLDVLKYTKETEETKKTKLLMPKKLKMHQSFIVKEGIDIDEIRNWEL